MKHGKTKTSGDVNRFQFRSVLLRLIGKVTVLMFLPTLGLLGVGAVIDAVYRTAPLGMLIGVTVGFAIAILLIIRLIHQLKEGRK
jgi:F0F1-type ATP synthase assembly protein I